MTPLGVYLDHKTSVIPRCTYVFPDGQRRKFCCGYFESSVDRVQVRSGHSFLQLKQPSDQTISSSSNSMRLHTKQTRWTNNGIWRWSLAGMTSAILSCNPFNADPRGDRSGWYASRDCRKLSGLLTGRDVERNITADHARRGSDVRRVAAHSLRCYCHVWSFWSGLLRRTTSRSLHCVVLRCVTLHYRYRYVTLQIQIGSTVYFRP